MTSMTSAGDRQSPYGHDKVAEDLPHKATGTVDYCHGQIKYCGKRAMQLRKWIPLLLVGSLVAVLFNLALTLWIIRSLRLTSKGIGDGNLSFLRQGGIKVKSLSVIEGSLAARFLRGGSLPSSAEPRPLTVNLNEANVVGITDAESDTHFLVSRKLRNNGLAKDGHSSSMELNIQASKFTVVSNPNQLSSHDHESRRQMVTTFEATGEQVTLSEAYLPSLSAISSSTGGGYRLSGALETDLLESSIHENLLLESRSGSLGMSSRLGSIDFHSRGGSIEIESRDSVTLSSGRAIYLDSSQILLKGLTAVSPMLDPNHYSQLTTTVTAYQMCVCENGHLFLSTPSGGTDGEQCSIDATLCNAS